MEEKKVIKFNLPILIFVFLQLLFIILIVVAINRANSEKIGVINVEVEGLANEIPNLPEYGKEDIEYSIYAAISAATPEINKKGIYIRDGSIIDIYYEDAGKRYINFVADIPTLERSYRVIAEWDDGVTGDLLYDSASGGKIGVLCLEKDELIYGEFDCKPYREYMKNVILGSLLEAGAETISSDVTLIPRYGESGESLRIEIRYSDCGETQCVCRVAIGAEKEEISKELDGLIEKLGFRADDIPRYFSDCDNEYMWVDEAGVLHQKVDQ